jgi:hypothetical protein
MTTSLFSTLLPQNSAALAPPVSIQPTPAALAPPVLTQPTPAALAPPVSIQPPPVASTTGSTDPSQNSGYLTKFSLPQPTITSNDISNMAKKTFQEAELNHDNVEKVVNELLQKNYITDIMANMCIRVADKLDLSDKENAAFLALRDINLLIKLALAVGNTTKISQPMQGGARQFTCRKCIANNRTLRRV